MDNSISLVELILHANFIVQLIMLGLVAMSVYSWAIMFEVNNRVKNIVMNRFSLISYFGQVIISRSYMIIIYNIKENIFGKSIIFCSGLREFNNLKDTCMLRGDTILEGMERTVSIAIAQEAKELDRKLPALATIGAVAPYIGLVGTVWGLCHHLIL